MPNGQSWGIDLLYIHRGARTIPVAKVPSAQTPVGTSLLTAGIYLLDHSFRSFEQRGLVMEIALKVIVGVGALVLLLSLFLIKAFSWLVKKGVITFSAAPTPSRIQLEQDPDVRWQDEFERDKARSKLALYDLKDLGYFTIYEMKGVILNAFVHGEKGLLVVLYEHPAVGQWVDFAVQFHDGGSFTVTSAKAGHELERRPNHDKIYCPGASVEALSLTLQRYSASFSKTLTRKTWTGGTQEAVNLPTRSAELRRVPG